MKLEIRGINPRYSGGKLESVMVSYSVNKRDGSLNISGHLVIDAEEYDLNASISALEETSKTHLIEVLKSDLNEEEGNEEGQEDYPQE